MKRFYKNAGFEPAANGWQATLDDRPIRTQGGKQQIVPTETAARLLAQEWQAQGDKIDPKSFFFRDLADFAIDIVHPRRADTVGKLLSYAETDTLCYRADPDEALYQRQQVVWEPIVQACEACHGAVFERTSGILHRPQNPQTLAALRSRLENEDEFTLSALVTLASLAASIIVPLSVIDRTAQVNHLFDAANCEEDWQAELWGWDELAQATRKTRLEAFEKASQFAFAVRP